VAPYKEIGFGWPVHLSIPPVCRGGYKDAEIVEQREDDAIFNTSIYGTLALGEVRADAIGPITSHPQGVQVRRSITEAAHSLILLDNSYHAIAIDS
jgi:hypothetical protein